MRRLCIGTYPNILTHFPNPIFQFPNSDTGVLWGLQDTVRHCHPQIRGWKCQLQQLIVSMQQMPTVSSSLALVCPLLLSSRMLRPAFPLPSISPGFNLLGLASTHLFQALKTLPSSPWKLCERRPIPGVPCHIFKGTGQTRLWRPGHWGYSALWSCKIDHKWDCLKSFPGGPSLLGAHVTVKKRGSGHKWSESHIRILKPTP